MTTTESVAATLTTALMTGKRASEAKRGLRGGAVSWMLLAPFPLHFSYMGGA